MVYHGETSASTNTKGAHPVMIWFTLACGVAIGLGLGYLWGYAEHGWEDAR